MKHDASEAPPVTPEARAVLADEPQLADHSSPMSRLLLIVCRDPGTTLARLSNRMHLDAEFLRLKLQRMQDMGLVRSGVAEGMRATGWHGTALGRQVAKPVHDARRAVGIARKARNEQSSKRVKDVDQLKFLIVRTLAAPNVTRPLTEFVIGQRVRFINEVMIGEAVRQLVVEGKVKAFRPGSLRLSTAVRSKANSRWVYSISEEYRGEIRRLMAIEETELLQFQKEEAERTGAFRKAKAELTDEKKAEIAAQRKLIKATKRKAAKAETKGKDHA